MEINIRARYVAGQAGKTDLVGVGVDQSVRSEIGD